MNTLNHDWLTEGLIDFEYKKYILLAYLKNVKQNFNDVRLYPFLSELVFHYNNLKKIKEHKEMLYEQFPKKISKMDFKKLSINYKAILKDDEVMQSIEEIIGYAMPELKKVIGEGIELYEFVHGNIEIKPVGLCPLYNQEGYIFFNQDSQRDVIIYRYQVKLFENDYDNYKGVSTTYLLDDFQDFSRSYEKIKLDLAKKFKELPNPASYLVICKMKFPLPETVLPIVKRLLIKEISIA